MAHRSTYPRVSLTGDLTFFPRAREGPINGALSSGIIARAISADVPANDGFATRVTSL
jgi:hypothetical protein